MKAVRLALAAHKHSGDDLRRFAVLGLRNGKEGRLHAAVEWAEKDPAQPSPAKAVAHHGHHLAAVAIGFYRRPRIADVTVCVSGGKARCLAAAPFHL